MKKQFFVYLFAALTLGGVVTSCSDDDDDLIPEKPEVKPEEKPEEKPVVNPISQKTTYAGQTLVLNYSGVSMLGKQVVFTPDASNANKATIVLSGEEASSKAEGLSLSNGVIPGEVSTTLNLDLTINGETVTFKGESAENGRTISYEGTADKTKMTLDLKVAMPANPFQGKNIVLFKDETGKDALAPMNLVWNIMAENAWTGVVEEQDATMFLKMALGMVKVDDLTLSQCLYAVLNQVSFLADGNIQAQYKDTPQSNELKTSPLNLATYTSAKEGEIRLFLNVPQIIVEATKAQTKADKGEVSVESLLPYIAEVLPQLIAMAPQLLNEGILINYEVDANGVMFVYLDKEVLLPILKLFSPVLQNEDFLKTLGEIVNAEMPGFGPTVAALLKGMPTWFENTTKMKIGVKFTEAK